MSGFQQSSSQSTYTSSSTQSGVNQSLHTGIVTQQPLGNVTAPHQQTGHPVRDTLHNVGQDVKQGASNIAQKTANILNPNVPLGSNINQF